MDTTYYVTLHSSESVYGTVTFPPYTKIECATKIVQIKTNKNEERNLVVVENTPGKELKQLSDYQIEILLGECLVFRFFAPSRPDLSYPTFRGTGNLKEALEYFEEFKEDVPGLASELRLEYQLLPEWTPLA